MQGKYLSLVLSHHLPWYSENNKYVLKVLETIKYASSVLDNQKVCKKHPRSHKPFCKIETQDCNM